MFVLLILWVGFLSILKNPELLVSQIILTTLKINIPSPHQIPQIDITNCTNYFDGCNTCDVIDGTITSCTESICETAAEPQCLEYISTGTNITGDSIISSWIVLSWIVSSWTAPTTYPFSDTELGVSFSYPNSWGNITKEAQSNSWSQYLLTFLQSWHIFFAFHNGGKPLARWSFWWDAAQHITTSGYINDFCTNKTGCTLHTNSNGIPYVKYYFDEWILWSSGSTSIILYYLFNPNSSFHGIIMSNESMLDQPEAIRDAIVDSIQFN